MKQRIKRRMLQFQKHTKSGFQFKVNVMFHAQYFNECKDIFEKGYREVTLLGQNVDSYRWNISSKGQIKDQNIPTTNFAQLMERVALLSPDLRIRFSTSHPKDMSEDLIEVYKYSKKLMPLVHLPVQSGSNKVLDLMNRKHNINEYHKIYDRLKEINSNIQFSSDFIIGYPGEEEEDFISINSLINQNSRF